MDFLSTYHSYGLLGMRVHAWVGRKNPQGFIDKLTNTVQYGTIKFDIFLLFSISAVNGLLYKCSQVVE